MSNQPSSIIYNPKMAGRFRGYLPIIVDIEAGGLNPLTDALLEIAAVTVNCDADGKFDSDNIFPGNIIMLSDAEGNQFYANVGEITEDKVVVDLNHPHAGKDLTFEGKVIEMREATNKEIQELVNMMSGGCGGSCEGCGGGCGEHHHEDEDCCCGHCH